MLKASKHLGTNMRNDTAVEGSGTTPMGQLSSINSNQPSYNKKYASSVNRRNNQGCLQETASGHKLDTESQERNSQTSQNNFNSLRNSKSLTKKLSTTVAKKSKRLKKSESQVKHTQLAK